MFGLYAEKLRKKTKTDINIEYWYETWHPESFGSIGCISYI